MSDEKYEKRICHYCIGERYLSDSITKIGFTATCDYCGDDEEPTITVFELADDIEAAFKRHYERTSPDPDDFQSAMLRDREIDYEWWREGEQVVSAIANAAHVTDDVAQDVLEILEARHAVEGKDYHGYEQEFDSGSCYEEKGANDYEFRMEWDAVERSIKEQTRFFNRNADAFLTRLFENLDQLADSRGRRVVVNAGPDQEIKSFYRARAFHSGVDDEIVRALKRPDREIGPPPPRFARSGRMNAQGISVFYGASDLGTALAEIRPPVGSRVVVGRFDLARPARLLDVEALRSVFIEGSIFDPDYIGRLELAQFLGRLSERMTMPVMPDDEPKEYLITQMIADFVAQIGDPPIDGMLYRSVQSAGDHKNVVLFNHSSRVSEWDVPPNAKLDARCSKMDEDGGSIDYSVIEWLPSEEEMPAEPKWPFGLDQIKPFVGNDDMSFFDCRMVTLELDPKSLQVHHVSGFTIATESFAVDRHRYQRPAFPKIAGLPDIEVPDQGLGL